MKKITLIVFCLLVIATINVHATKIVVVSGASIQSAIDAATSGDTLVLVDGGIYSGAITVNKSIILKSENTVTLPKITTSGIGLQGGKGYYFELESVEVIGDPGVTNKHMMQVNAGGDSVIYLKLSNVVAHEFERTVLKLDKATCYVDSVIVDNCHFYNFNKGGWNGFYWRDERVITKYFSLTNTTLDGFNEGIIRFDGVTFVKKIYVDRCTFNDRSTYNATIDANPLLDINGPAGSVFKMTNCIMSDVDSISVPAFGIDATIADTIMNCRFFFDEGAVDTTHTWNYKSEFSKEDPDYYNPSKRDLTLPAGSSFLTASTTGGIIGDPRWMPETLDPELVAYYRFDDNDIVNDSVVLDVVRNSDGVVKGDTAAWVAGYLNEAIDFSAMADTSIIMAPDHPATDFDSTNSFTISLILKIAKSVVLSGEDMIIKKGSNNTQFGGNGKWYGLAIKDGNFRFSVDDNITKSDISSPLPAWYPENDWAHIVVVRNRATDSLILYCNGRLQKKISDATELDIASGLPLIIGNYYNLANKANGLIDEVKLFNVAFNDNEVMTMSDEYGLLYTSTDASLSGINIDGTPLTGFHKDTLEYNVELPYGTIAVPIVTVTTSDPTAIDSITNATSLPGTTTILVTAPDSIAKRTYLINFTLLPYVPSSDATLSALSVDLGTLTPTFHPDSTDYSVNDLPVGTTSVTVTAIANHDSATVENPGAVDVSSGSGSVDIVVTAEDATTRTYHISFTVLTGIEEFIAHSVVLQFNRKTEILSILNAMDVSSINIYSISGQNVMKINADKQLYYNINVSSLEKGTYIIHVSYNKASQSFKIVK